VPVPILKQGRDLIATIQSVGFAEVARSQQVLAFENLAHRASL